MLSARVEQALARMIPAIEIGVAMVKPTESMTSTQLSTLQTKLDDSLKKEQKIYEALAALVNFLSGNKKLDTRVTKSSCFFSIYSMPSL